jgi:hypothetical protein
MGVLESLARTPDDATVVMLAGGVDGYFVAHADFDDLTAWAGGDTPPGDPNAWEKATESPAARQRNSQFPRPAGRS